MLAKLTSLLSAINVSSQDNGKVFTDPTRREQIRHLLVGSSFNEQVSPEISLIYVHERIKEAKGVFLLSCHIDSRYTKHFHDTNGPERWLGTFDNSICNAILVQAMLEDRLPVGAIVAFTGDEEVQSRGATQTMEWFQTRTDLWERLCAAIVLDVTAVGYGSLHFTVENGFVEKESLAGEPHFRSEQELYNVLEKILSTGGFLQERGDYAVVPSDEAGEDESWEYDEWDLNCFSLCIPTASHPKNAKRKVEFWMHDERGIYVETEAILAYTRALDCLCLGIARDLPW